MTPKIRQIQNVTQASLNEQWDRLAEARYLQIISGEDVSYNDILVPTILDMLGDVRCLSVLDVGCGVGALTHRISLEATSVVGIDSSKKCIELARQKVDDQKNVSFYNMSIEKFSQIGNKRFDVAIGNMLLMDVISLNDVMRAISRCLDKKGRLMMTLCHPWFWPQYAGYARERWFNYNKEIAIEADFRISRSTTYIGTSIHFHRPLETYVREFWKAGFSIVDVREPFPNGELMRKYPKAWRFPRFLAILAERR